MTVSTRLSATGLLGIAGLHVLWATGSSWPMKDGSDLSGARSHTAAECLAVAGLLGAAAGFVAGRPRRLPQLSRAGGAVVVAVLTTRGAFGLAGRTDILVPGASSDRFRALDRRVYAPLCLALALGALPATRR
jgi:Protein of unknown function (DUF3995)